MKYIAIALLVLAAAANVHAAAYLEPIAYLHDPSKFNTNWKPQVSDNRALLAMIMPLFLSADYCIIKGLLCHFSLYYDTIANLRPTNKNFNKFCQCYQVNETALFSVNELGQNKTTNATNFNWELFYSKFLRFDYA